MKICTKTGAPCKNGYNGCSAIQQKTDNEINMKVGDSTFHKVLSVDSLFEVFQKNPNSSYVLHGGNTAHGNVFTMTSNQTDNLACLLKRKEDKTGFELNASFLYLYFINVIYL